MATNGGDVAVPERWRLGESFVPKGRYTDAEFLRLEHERLFPRVWQMACREEELPEAGSFHEYGIGRESVLVVRQPDGGIRAFHNVCRHRGMRLVRGAGREGLQHVAYWTSEFEDDLQRCLDAGFVVGQQGVAGGANGRFVYFDTEAHPGTVVELSDSSGAKGAFFKHIAEIARTWDGREPVRRL